MTTTIEPTNVPEGDPGTTGTAGTAGVAVPALRPANATAGTAQRAAVTGSPRTGTSRTAGTGSDSKIGGAWWQRYRRTPGPGAGTAPTEPAGPVPALPPDAGTSAGTGPAEAARIESALRAAARTGSAATKKSKARTGTDDAELPVPAWAKTGAAYGSWLLGELPLIAPMIVSGWYTYHVGTQSLGQPWPIALLLTAALEGVAYKLAKLYEKRLVAGLSTVAERLGLLGVVAAIAALIYWHATNKAGGLDNWEQADWRPASVAAAMSAIGVFVYGRSARWARRAELMAEGRVDMQALRIGVWQWIVSPWESLWGFRHGMKYRIGNPAEAVRDWRLWKVAGKPKDWPPTLADVLGTDSTRPVQVPAWLLETLQAGPGTGTAAAPRTSGTKEPAGTNPSVGTGTSGPASTGTHDGEPGGTGAGTSGSVGNDDTGTGVGTEPTAEQIAAWRERHRERLIRVRQNIRARDDSAIGWDEMPEGDLSLSRICDAGGFKNKTDASQVAKVLLHDRRQRVSQLTHIPRS